MKHKLLLLTIAVLGTCVLAHAVNVPSSPGAACSNVPGPIIAAINAVLTALGLPTVC